MDKQLVVRKYLNVKQLAEMLNVSPDTVYYWAENRRIPHLKFGRLVRFEINQVNVWLQEREIKVI